MFRGIQKMVCRSYSTEYDITIVGGGIVGLATAQELAFRHSGLKISVLEKENTCGTHQTGHNSGVIHAGIYYKPKTLMASLCLEGMKSTYLYCDHYQVPYKKIGKIIVATSENQIAPLTELYKRALVNEVPDVKYLDSEKEIQEYEPKLRGIKGIWSPWTGIVDWEEVAKKYASNFIEKGNGVIHYNYQVTSINPNQNDGVEIKSMDKVSLWSRFVITCAGLHSDRIAEMTGSSKSPRIIPFRGEYSILNEENGKMIQRNIYPVPDPRFPFLGVHFTPRMNGDIWVGPNALLALDREGYSRYDFNFKDWKDMFSYLGFYRLASKYIGFGLKEIYQSSSSKHIMKELKNFVPDLDENGIRCGPSGIRAQAVSPSGELIGDFVFDDSLSKVLHVRNAPSPGATSSLAIGRMLADKAEKQFGLVSHGNAKLY